MSTNLPTEVRRHTIWEGAPLKIKDRILGLNEQPVTQATLASIALYVYDLSTGSQVLTTLALDKTEVVFDALQEWDEDDAGFNFALEIPGTYFPEGGGPDQSRNYRVEVRFTTVAGDSFLGRVWRVEVLGTGSG